MQRGGQGTVAHAGCSERCAVAPSRQLSLRRDIAPGQQAGPPCSGPLGRHARLPGLDALSPAEYRRRSSAHHAVVNGRPPRSSVDRSCRPLSHCRAPTTRVADRYAYGGALRHSCVVSCALHLRRWGGAWPWTGPHGVACRQRGDLVGQVRRAGLRLDALPRRPMAAAPSRRACFASPPPPTPSTLIPWNTSCFFFLGPFGPRAAFGGPYWTVVGEEL